MRDEADGQLAAAEAEFHRLEAILSRFRPDSELSRLNEAGTLEAGPELLEVVESRSRRGSGRGGASIPPFTTRSSPPATTARSSRRCRRDGRDAGSTSGGARAHRAARGSSWARTSDSTSAASARATPRRGPRGPRTAGPASSTPAATSRSGRARGPSGSRRLRRTHTRALLRRARDIRPRSTALAPKRTRAPPSDRPATGRPSDSDLLRRDRRRRRRRRGRGLGEGALPRPAKKKPRGGRRPGLPCVLVTADGRTRLAGGLAMKRSDLLDPRARERPHRVRPADAVRPRRARPQVAAVRAGAERRRGDGHAPISRARSRSAPSLCTGSRWCSTRPCRSPRGARRAGLAPYRPLLDGARRRRRESWLSDRDLVSAPEADRRAPGDACTGRRTASSRSRPSGLAPARIAAARGSSRLYLGASGPSSSRPPGAR